MSLPSFQTSPDDDLPVPDGPFLNWSDVLEKVMKYDIPLFGILADSTASIKSGRVVISSENPTLFDFICTESHARELSRAVFEVMGRKMKIAVSNNEKQKTDKSPLENLKAKINSFNNN